MNNLFDIGLHYLGKNKQDVFVMNIGAMDGVLFDEMVGYTQKYNFKGLYVEPIPYLFEKLKNNIGDKENNFFENSAISDYDGEIEMLTIMKDAIDNGLVHNCFYGMSAVYPPKNGLGSEGDRETVEKYGEVVKVSCITFETLLKKYNITDFDVIKIDAEGHDFKIFKQIDIGKYKPSIIRIEWINLNKDEQLEIKDIFKKHNYEFELLGQDIIGISSELCEKIEPKFDLVNGVKNKTTIVTGIWDIKRDELSIGWNRGFEHYLNNLSKLMETDCNMIIYIENKYKSFVEERRSNHNTLIIVREIDWFKLNTEIYNNIQKIRTSSIWLNQVDWLPNSTQSKLEWYNPIVMSKMFLLNDSTIIDPFNSTHMIWVDGGITNTVHEGYFTHDKVINKISKYIDKFTFISFPYDGIIEIHGFDYNAMCKYSNTKINRVCRGGIFGGPKDSIRNVNNIYYDLIMDTLNNGYMGTEESLFTIISYKYPELTQYYEINKNGLLSTFFENLKNDNLEPKTIKSVSDNNVEIGNVGLYVITFNSPNQFESLIKSMLEYDDDFIIKPKKFLLDNSTDLDTTPKYIELCKEYGFEHIKKDNIGIVGGRIFVAEHFDESDLDCYFWFEDDMFFYNKTDTCKNGFNRFVSNLYKKTLEIINKEGFDFLKLNFTEFFGDNSTQWAWYNLPQEKRDILFPENTQLPSIGFGVNPPKTKFNNIKSHMDVPYVTGEIYLCNWPILLSKEGNYKCYLKTKWTYPYEQTLMSHCYQETVKGRIKGGLLLMTPTEHNRFDHYESKLRKEC